jgi:hypothetical protein
VVDRGRLEADDVRSGADATGQVGRDLVADLQQWQRCRLVLRLLTDRNSHDVCVRSPSSTPLGMSIRDVARSSLYDRGVAEVITSSHASGISAMT